ncbi:MAG: pilus assembly protein [Bradyrhizobiaceae bacterium]|nr:MAG: pilus assembly protein [Bradyrhizobiaceae bacterium]
MLKFAKPVSSLLTRFSRDTRGLAATEFAIILPMMLVIFFGTIEVSTGVAVDRKVTILTRTLSDLISQASSVSNTDLTNAFTIGASIMTPYSSAPIKAIISQVYIDPTTLQGKVKWSTASNDTAHACNATVNVPTGLAIGGTYLIMSEVRYNFQPMVDINFGTPPTFTLGDTTYTRPRQSTSVTNTSAAACT